MNCAEKMFKIAECWDNFRSNCNNEELKHLVDIFYPMCLMHGENGKENVKLEISIGSKKKDCFQSYLSVSTNKFSVVTSRYEDEPMLILRDETNRTHHTLAAINLAKINDLHIDKGTYNSVNCYRYNIYFNYCNKFDYCVHMVSME